MTTAIRKHLVDFLAVVALFALAIGIAAYILSQERLRFPFVQAKPETIKVALANAQAVTPGQGQTVRVAGVKVGDISNVEVHEGRALVTLEIDPKYKGLIRQDATALLRSRTGLQDMFIEVDPGHGKPVSSGGTIPAENTLPQNNPDEVLSALDADTRDYLQLLISGGGKGLNGRAVDLRETLKLLSPVHRDLKRVATAVAARRNNLRRLVNRYGLLTEELGRHDRDLVRLVRASNSVLGAFAQENRNLSSAVAELPGSLRTTQSTLVKVNQLSGRLRPALDALRPPIRQLATTNHAVLPFVREATPIIRSQIRPFARVAQPNVRNLGKAASSLSSAAPSLTTSFHELNRALNIGAYNPHGTEGISTACETRGACTPAERARNEGYLYWLTWVGQNTITLFGTADAQGPFRRVTLGGVPCTKAAAPAVGIDALNPASQGTLQALAGVIGGLGLCSLSGP
jgi:phospholipid/cholesterol/gamma-HCH transport system substrate-binding protein